MCYNIAYLEARAEKYYQRYKDVPQIPWSAQFKQLELPVSYFQSGFSHPLIPAVLNNGFELLQWGLIPFWVKDAAGAKDISKNTLNAVGETAFEKPSFRSSIAKKRCLIGVSGFYEWRDVNKVKYPYFIKVKGQEIFSLGCIYESWTDKATGEMKKTFSIVTTPANPLMEKIHNLKKRMPLILHPQDEAAWLNPDLSREQIESLIKPFPENEMEAYTVSKNVNSAKNFRDTAESIAPVIYPELEAL